MELFSRKLEICEVGPRDGLQNLKRKFSVSERVDLVDRLIDAGACRIEVGSFVNTKRVPNMGGFEEVLDRIKRQKGVTISGLSLNEKGVERALSHGGLDEIRFVLVASDTFSKINQGASVSQTLQALRNVSKKIKIHNVKLSVVIAAAFGCPYEGNIKECKVIDLVKKSLSYGAKEIIVADTIGSGLPSQVTSFIKKVTPLLGEALLGFHFHNTRNTGYANAMAAINGGADILDASIGGIGGCPFVPNATGNIATEDLLYLIPNSEPGLSYNKLKLLEIVDWLKELIPEYLTGKLSDAGYFPDYINYNNNVKK
jgi:hydroxymethylglutaryl-CoA lyase